MWLLIVVSAIVYVSADITQEAKVFHKCCPKTQSLGKVSDGEDFEASYQCIDRKSAQDNYNISITPLFVGDQVPVKDGIPANCEQLQMVQTTSSEVDKRLQTLDNCFDRLVLEVINGTLKPIIPEVVGLSCIKNEPLKTPRDKLIVHHYRKCCPAGQSYDSVFHLCRNTDRDNSEDWVLKRLKMNERDIYEVDNGLNCTVDEYGVELKEQFFSFKIDGSNLKALSRKGDGERDAPPGEWCVDKEYYSDELVARVCSRDPSQYGAFGVRKCCPMGHHYKLRRCGSTFSDCTPNLDDVFFNLSDYLKPLRLEHEGITDVLGIRTYLDCPNGRVVLNKSKVVDRHQLMSDGRLASPISVSDNYCIESYDLRNCHGDIFVTAVTCFKGSPVKLAKDFRMSFILICFSSVCLLLTLVVYLSLPELRNLHGRTLICHLCTMLLAFGCLARSQYGPVASNTACTLIGYGIYFGFVAAFAWLNVMCFDIWRTFGSVRTVKSMRKADAELRRFLWYSLYAWGTSILMTVAVYLFDTYPVSDLLDSNIGDVKCWFAADQNSKSDWPHYIFFVIPMGVVTCINFVLWVLTTRHCAKVKAEDVPQPCLQADSVGDRAKRRFHVARAKYVLAGKLWVVMGAGWISELLSTMVANPGWLWSIIDVINQLQGVLMFLILVFKPKVYYLIRKRLGLEKPDAQKSSSARTSASSTFLSQTISTDERNNTRLSVQKQS